MKDNMKESNTNNAQELTLDQLEKVAGGFEWLKPVPKG